MTYTVRVQRRNVEWPTTHRWEWQIWEPGHANELAIDHGITITQRGARREAQRQARRHHRRKHHFDAQTATYTIDI